MIVNEEVQQPESVFQGPGQILRQARERAKLSTQDIADKIKLKRALIEEIEQDNFDINISLTFVRGYLKLYAKHVHVEETEVLNAYEKLSTQKREPAKLQSFSRRVANQSNDDKLMLVTYLISAVIITLVVIYWFQQSSTDATASNVTKYPENVISQEILPLEQTLTSDAATLLSPQINVNMSSDDSNVTKELITDNQSISPEKYSDTDSLAVLADATETSIVETKAPVKLIFEFSGDCWLNLTDATGENIAYGVKVNGRVMPVNGIPPFVVTLGAPEVVKIRYAGESIDMSFLPSGRIAKFNLPLSE
ncbi:RodZ domain-containing protein [uncultured Paraglaciecola sp.]|jgi:cytoskeleton protein RodZ|uniref:RodZ domain-containing protein n=1 Tax=uncultured Paraglaciecola sp. TaxID=1765024 RepID=UPI00262DE3D1|nr:RodZ domain-containing protein [uncultured Paraglaciecola sp.]